MMLRVPAEDFPKSASRNANRYVRAALNVRALKHALVGEVATMSNAGMTLTGKQRSEATRIIQALPQGGLERLPATKPGGSRTCFTRLMKGGCMLIITFHNDGTGGQTNANYDVKVSVTAAPERLVPLWAGRLENHNRALGWEELVRRLAERTAKVAVS